MFAALAALAFALALILRLLVPGTSALVTDFTLAGLLCVALHLAFGIPLRWRSTRATETRVTE